jgi:hypothetical protein
MKLSTCSLCASFAVLVAVSGCASETRHADASTDTKSVRAVIPSDQTRGREVLIEADRQMKDLARLRDQATDPFVQEAMTRQLDDLRVRSDRLMDEMTIGDARVHDPAIRADVTNLQRTMAATANAELQAAPSYGP